MHTVNNQQNSISIVAPTIDSGQCIRNFANGQADAGAGLYPGEADYARIGSNGLNQAANDLILGCIGRSFE